jgi:hypothetical protein
MRFVKSYVKFYRQFRNEWGYPVLFAAREAFIYAKAYY